jgi:hypothetical protein
MIADQATPATLIAHMIVTISEISLHASGSLRIDIGKPLEFFVRVSRHLPLSSSDPPGFPISALLFLGQRSDGIALPLGSAAQVACRSFPACSLRVSGTLGEVSYHAKASAFSQALRSFATPKIIMAHQSRSGTVQFALDISSDARLRFESLHQSMGLKTKAQTFEAILYFVSTKDKIDPAALQRMEKKIDHSIYLLESLT